jgi:hypothetical protein
MNPTQPIGPSLVLDLMKMAVQRRVTREAIQRVVDTTTYIDHIADAMVVQLTTYVATEHLPSQAFGVQVTAPHYITWWDHYKAAHWERSWMWYLRDWGWIKEPRTVDRQVHTTVNVRARWAYPDTPLPREGLGRPIVYTETEQFGGL